MPVAVEKVAFWELEPSDVEQASPVPHSVEPCIFGSGVTDIGIFPEEADARVPVDKADVQPGGKYYSVVKLLIRNQPSGIWTMGTGWLCQEGIVITAGHNVVSGDQHATHVRVCIGHSASSNGAGASSDHQRSVTRIALPSAWSDAKADQSNVAFLQLDKPFQDVTPIKCGTPGTKAQENFTVVGYPSDLGTSAGSPGGEMHQIKISREINLEETRWNMLMYQGDTQGGMGGAPIIRDSDSAAIGVHARGGSFNFGTVIGGAFGINFTFYKEVLGMLEKRERPDSTLRVETDADRDWLNYVYVV